MSKQNRKKPFEEVIISELSRADSAQKIEWICQLIVATEINGGKELCDKINIALCDTCANFSFIPPSFLAAISRLYEQKINLIKK